MARQEQGAAAAAAAAAVGVVPIKTAPPDPSFLDLARQVLERVPNPVALEAGDLLRWVRGDGLTESERKGQRRSDPPLRDRTIAAQLRPENGTMPDTLRHVAGVLAEAAACWPAHAPADFSQVATFSWADNTPGIALVNATGADRRANVLAEAIGGLVRQVVAAMAPPAAKSVGKVAALEAMVAELRAELAAMAAAPAAARVE